ncbi:MAG: BrnT family toxin [Candidatus Competibacteraceae bacterium]
MRISFNPAKAKTNLKKHGVSFADAALIFEGFVISREDDRAAYGEQRFISIGLGCGVTVLVVAHLLEPDHIHIISARKAEPHEARHYWRAYAKQQGG